MSTESDRPQVDCADGATRQGPSDRPGQERVVPSRPVRVVRSSAETLHTEKRSLWVYVKHALMHPWHVVVLAGATVFGVGELEPARPPRSCSRERS